MNIGKIIRTLREEKGLTQEELAKMVGYKSKSTVNKIELGVNEINQPKILAFAKALNVSPARLIDIEEPPAQFEPSMKGQPFWVNYQNLGSSVREDEGTYKEVSEEEEKDMTIKVKDDAMDIFGIKKGDTIYIQEQKHAEDGDIIAVVVNGIIIVRAYYFDGKKAVLIGSRKTTPIFEDFQIIGVVKYVKSKI